MLSSDAVVHEQAVWVASTWAVSGRSRSTTCSLAQGTHQLNSADLSASRWV